MKNKIIKILTFTVILCLLSFSLVSCVTPNNKLPNNNVDLPIETPPEADPPQNEKEEIPLAPLAPAIHYNIMISAKTDNLNIRTSPSNSSTVIGKINTKDMVVYVGKTGEWYITKYRNQKAYISANNKYTELKKFKKSSDSIEKIFNIGLPLLGIKYVYGAERYHWGQGQLNPKFNINEFDCSSFTQYIYYKSHKVLLNTTSRTQSVQGQFVNKEYLKRGDIMFFTNSSRQHLSGIDKVGHVGIYFGDNYILHTASDYSVVEFISNARWKYYLHSRRVAW